MARKVAAGGKSVAKFAVRSNASIDDVRRHTSTV
jgi:hypothetical protein